MDGRIDAEESRRIAVTRWPLIVLVVLIHANNERIGLPAPEGGAARVVHLVRQFLSEGVAAVAVPLFFLLAGRLYFRGPGLGIAAYRRKVRSRARTLVVPYLLWNGLVALAIVLAARVPGLSALASGERAAALSGGPGEVVAGVLGLGRDPVAYQFWFIRDLVVVAFVLAPLYALAYRARAAAAAAALALGLPWLLHAWPLASFSVVGPLFFLVGGWFGWRERSPFPRVRALAWLLPLWVALMAADFLGLAGDLFPYVRQVAIAVGCAAMLGVATWAAESRRTGDLLVRASAGAFFLFAVHEPALTALRRVAERLAGTITPAVDLAIYLGTAVAVVALAAAGQWLLGRVAPRALAVLTGGR